MDIREIRLRVLLKYYFDRYPNIQNISKIKWQLDDHKEEVNDSEVILYQDDYLDGECISDDSGNQIFTSTHGINNIGIRKIEKFMDNFSEKCIQQKGFGLDLNKKFESLINNILSQNKPISESNPILLGIIAKHF